MLRWPDRLAIGAQNGGFAAGVPEPLFGIAPGRKKKEITFIVATESALLFFTFSSSPQGKSCSGPRGQAVIANGRASGR